MINKVLVVGAGFSGATIARELAENGFYVDVIEKRDHVGGNAYDYIDRNGIRIHKYGPHIFHTSNADVVNWLSRFTKWVEYKHKVKGMLSDGRLVTLPANLETKLIVGEENIIETFYRPYTQKMWAINLHEIDKEVLNRVNSRNDFNDFYFPNDIFQAIPMHGYTEMFRRILAHENISVSLGTIHCEVQQDDYFHVFNSMSIDEYYDFCFGELPYRSIKFHHIFLPAPKIFPVATVNFTHNGPYTRITEWKNFPNHGRCDEGTILTYEEPCDYKENNGIRYYPVNDIEGVNRMLYQKYNKLAPPCLSFIGRCGMYTYLDMHQAVSTALATVRKFLRSVE